MTQVIIQTDAFMLAHIRAAARAAGMTVEAFMEQVLAQVSED